MDKIDPEIHKIAQMQPIKHSKLLKTVRLFQGRDDFEPRCYGTGSKGNVRTVAEGEDVIATPNDKFTTFVPQRRADRLFLSDNHPKSGSGNPILDVATELEQDFAHNLDSDIAESFANFTGGTVGGTGKTLTWATISAARKILWANKVHGRFFCVLHPYQWVHLVNTVHAMGHTLSECDSDELQGVYFESLFMTDTTFVVTPAVTIDASDDALGGMYVMNTIGVDIRKRFTVEAQRDASREATEINASMVYDVGILNPELGVKIVSDASSPEQD